MYSSYGYGLLNNHANVDQHLLAAVAEALKIKRSVQLAAALQTPGGEAGGLAEAYDRVQRLQGNVVDLSAWDLSQGSADSQEQALSLVCGSVPRKECIDAFTSPSSTSSRERCTEGTDPCASSAQPRLFLLFMVDIRR